MSDCKVSEVRPGVYVGCQAALQRLESLSIAYVLSLGLEDSRAATGDSGPTRRRKSVQIEDKDDANLLQHLEDCCNFIAEGSHSSGVLVHCVSGVSRSAAVVLAYIMWSERISLDQAMEIVKSSHPEAAPNDGFLEQLRLFHQMGCRIDTENEAYRRFSLQQLGRRWEEEGHVDPGSLGDVPEGSVQEPAGDVYRCRKCRTPVATWQHVVPVEEGPGQRGFAFHKRVKERGLPPSSKESSLFVEPLRWMQESILGPSGKLYCPECGERLGSFNWAGIQSNTARWVTPGFQLHLDKLDVRSPAVEAHLRGVVRRPRAALAARGGVGGLRPGGCRYLVFDCDGVLVDTEPLSCEALRRALLELTGFDIPHKFPDDYYPVFGMDVKNCCRHYKDAFKLDWDIDSLSHDLGEVKERWYRELTAEGIRHFPFVRELVARAAEQGIPVGIGSSGSPEKIAHNLSASGIADLFPPELIVSAKHVKSGKPAPDVYLEVLRRMNCRNPSSAIVIEDSINGLKAAKATGAVTVAITNTMAKDALEEHADQVVASLQELIDVL